MQVYGNDVARYFGSMGRAERQLARWKNLPGRGHVVEKVLTHVSSAIFEISSSQIRELKTEHPLGELREDFKTTVPLIRDWRPDFAFSHLFHFCLEDLGRIYSWQEFRDEWSAAPARRGWLWDPALTIRMEAADKLVRRHGWAEDRAWAAARDALQWRIGSFYYSFLREIYVLSWLRESGLPALSHPLADALFRADVWCGEVVVGIYINNPNYRSSTGGRKHSAQHYLGDQRRFRFVDLEMARPERFGKVALPTDDELQRCADGIRATTGP